MAGEDKSKASVSEMVPDEVVADSCSIKQGVTGLTLLGPNKTAFTPAQQEQMMGAVHTLKSMKGNGGEYSEKYGGFIHDCDAIAGELKAMTSGKVTTQTTYDQAHGK